MEVICSPDKCTGCAACMNACTLDAISMEAMPPLGDIHPRINSKKCINCGLCSRICPVNHPIQLNDPFKAFAAISKVHEDLRTSASGGASSVLCESVLFRGGVIYGCVQRNYQHIAHQRIDKLEEAYLLKGSKYVQSNIGFVFREVKADLDKGEEVLFTGTPCQVAGLKAYLHKDYDNLYLVDLVCHGVPSQKMLSDDVDQLLKGYPQVDRDGISVVFRRKARCTVPFEPEFGTFLHLNGEKLEGNPSKEKKKQSFLKDNYITAFMAGISFRENCYTCPYAQSKRTGDITIADFWGLMDKAFPAENGVSLIMPSSRKGMKLVQLCASRFIISERPVSEAIAGNGQLGHPSPRPAERDAFISTFPKNPEQSYRHALKRYRTVYSERINQKRKYLIRSRYEDYLNSNTLLRLLDRLPKFRGIILRLLFVLNSQ